MSSPAAPLVRDEQEILDEVRRGVAVHVAQLRAVETELEEIVLFDKNAMEGMGKWLLATLVAINGAAALGLMNAFSTQLPQFRDSLILFVAGVVSAVLSGLMERDVWSMAVRLQHSVKVMRESFADFENVRTTKDFLEKADQLDIKFRGRLLRTIIALRGFGATAFFYVSLGCFVAGVVLAGKQVA